MNIISLIGLKGSGKSTAAEVIRKMGYNRVSFASSLKHIVSSGCEIDPSLVLDPVLKETFELNLEPTIKNLDEMYELANEFYVEIKPSQYERMRKVWSKAPIFTTPRHLLQFVGTELFRDCVNDDYWIKALEHTLHYGEDYVIDDNRFLNEQEMIYRRNGQIIRIDRPSVKSTSDHPSENIDSLNYDYKILNLGLDEFKLMIRTTVRFLERAKKYGDDV